MEQFTEQQSQAEQTPRGSRKWNEFRFGESGKVNAAQAVNIEKAGKRKMDEMTGGEIFRLIQFLRSQGWTDEKIVKLIEFITR